ncbi:MAG: ABC transporter ATP-binding protein [Chloroflexi bacterium]|nr:ABC transporter ATP-binding protein [Chloroflexota bacterium]
MQSVISCVGLTRRFISHDLEPVEAVASVDLTVDDGEFIAIEGPSGSGKTTLMGLLAGLDLPDEGTVSVLGHDLSRLNTTERARLRRSRIGIVLQSYGLLAVLTAAENVALPLALDGVALLERTTRAAEALRAVGLGGAADARIDELSGGERQRVAVARALVIRPALVLADEPVGSLDDDNARTVLDLLVELNTTMGSAVVLVTHDPVSAGRADRHLRMTDGRLTEGIH